MSAPKPSDLFPRRPVISSRPIEDAKNPEKAPEFVPAVPDTAERDDDEATRARRATDYQLGNHELAIAGYRERITEAVITSQATVITAETGAGKSTQVPQFLAEAGYEVIVTQPRVVAARSVAERVRDEVVSQMGDDYKNYVGYRTARERGDSDENQILFVTDGLQQVRELAGRGVGKKQVLVLDEVHEWNENMEVLVAWAKKRMNEDPNFKVVVMSATMESGKLSEYFADNATREVPVIEVPGRTFEVKKEEGGDVADQAIKFAQEGKNTLVFVPGKAEIDQVIAEINRANIPGVTVLPLHGQLEPAEQRKVFAKYSGAKVIVATNVAQTSITIDDIDAVVDSGLERRNEVRNGVEGLYLNPVSQADCMQRAGRAGRTKTGEYVLAQLGNNPFASMKEREPYGTPEIIRTRLDGMVLRLAKNGFDAEELEFYHQPNPSEIVAAKSRLQKLGALTEDGSVTKVGRDMERMPVESHYARMMIEARKYGVEVQGQLAALLAIQEAGGILMFGTRNRSCDERWRSMLEPGFNDSDMIRQLEVFIAAQGMSGARLRDFDIAGKGFQKSKDIMRDLRRVEKLNGEPLIMPDAEQREQLVRCIVSGMVDNLYMRQRYGAGFTDSKGGMRETGKRSTVRPAEMIVGMPFDLEIVARGRTVTLNIIENVTNVPSVDFLHDVAPQLFFERRERFVVMPDGQIGEEWAVTFNGRDMNERTTKPATASPERRGFIIDQLVNESWYNNPYGEIVKEIERLQRKTRNKLTTITSSDVRGMLDVALPIDAATLDEARDYIPPVEIDDVISPEVRMQIDDENPDEFRGVPLHYENGQPYVGIDVSDEELVQAFSEVGALPNGKKIMFGNGYGARSVEQAVREAKEAITRQQIAHEKQRLDAEGVAEGLPSCVKIYRRIMGATHNSMGWVVSPDGSLREADAVPVDQYGRYDNPDGTMVWDQIRPGELVLSWTKADVISQHEFVREHLPKEGITPAQLATVLAIQEEIAQSWAVYDERKHDSRGDRSSPPVGRGWGLDPQSAEKEAQKNKVVQTVNDAIDTLDELGDDLDDDLRKRRDTLLYRANRLLEPGAQTHHEYANQVKQFVSLVNELVADCERRAAELTSGGVSQASLEALQARFNN